MVGNAGKFAIIGAGGCQGTAVARMLIDRGHHVRGFVRDARRAPEFVDDIAVGDAATGAGLERALADVDGAFYFIHSLDATDQDERDRAAARNFVRAARSTGLERAVFFTTLAVPEGVDPPLYQRNRLAVEREFRAGIPGTVVVRSGMVLDTRSRGLRPYLQLARRAPVIPMGPWRNNRIAVVDGHTVAECLVRAGTAPAPIGSVVEVPASAEPTHRELVAAVLRALHRRRPILDLPWSSPAVDAFLTSVITDDSFHFSRHLASINRYDYLTSPERTRPFADIEPLDLAAALAQAIPPSRKRPRPGVSAYAGR